MKEAILFGTLKYIDALIFFRFSTSLSFLEGVSGRKLI